MEMNYTFTSTEAADAPESQDRFLDDLLHLKSKVLSTKLEVLAFEVLWRFGIRAKNLDRLDGDQSLVQAMLEKLDRAANYHFREHREKGTLYQTFFSLQEQKRQQDTECWRDVVMVMRDFLYVWEAHEQMQARAIFLENVGRTIESHL